MVVVLRLRWRWAVFLLVSSIVGFEDEMSGNKDDAKIGRRVSFNNTFEGSFMELCLDMRCRWPSSSNTDTLPERVVTKGAHWSRRRGRGSFRVLIELLVHRLAAR